VIANGTREAASAACGVTPQAQNTGTSPSCSATGSPYSGRSSEPSSREPGSPTCTGAPCTAGIRPLIATAAATISAGIGRIETTIGPERRPAGRQARRVTYIDTFAPCSTCRSGMPVSTSADSKVNEHPMWKATRSSRQYGVASVGSATTSPSRQTR